MKHIVTICYTDFSHVQPMIYFLDNLLAISNWMLTIILPPLIQAKIKPLPSFPEQQRAGLFVYSIPDCTPSNDRLRASDYALIGIKKYCREAISKIHSAVAVDSIIIELFTACCAKEIVIKVPTFMFCTTSGLAFVHRYSRFIDATFDIEEYCDFLNLDQVNATTILANPQQLTFVENQFRSTPNLNDNLYFSFEKVSKSVVECLGQCHGVIINDVRELYTQNELNYVPMNHMKMYFCGPVFVPNQQKDENNMVLKWLNFQKEQSVIYVAFGTLENQSIVQINEILNALTSTITTFLYIVPKHAVDLISNQKLIYRPETALEDYKSLIVTWAPQQQVLQHKSIHSFLTHCGWNSFLENMYAGNPVICWPLFADQKMNALFSVSRHFGVLLKDTKVGGRLITVEEIVLALLEIKKPEYRTNARTMASIVTQWDQVSILKDFVHDLVKKR
jgi:hypothetical protein